MLVRMCLFWVRSEVSAAPRGTSKLRTYEVFTFVRSAGAPHSRAISVLKHLASYLKGTSEYGIFSFPLQCWNEAPRSLVGKSFCYG